MNIVMMTNTFTPMLGGVKRSVEEFSEAYRARGHHVLVIGPGEPLPGEEGVYRVPAIGRLTGSDFAVPLPLDADLNDALEEFRPDIFHAHHPFLLGDTALRAAGLFRTPLVFTHHTLWEEYAHYVPVKAKVLRRFVIALCTGYANLCDQVIVPSESIGDLLRRRGVRAPLAVVPTGVRPGAFSSGDGRRFRARAGIPQDAYLVGHVGRLAPEKNLGLLAWGAARFVAAEPRARALVVGKGPSQEGIREIFRGAGAGDRLHLPGPLEGEALADAYAAMDVFIFASRTETQGMVVTEAMAAGVPVIAFDAPGVREVVRDRENGLLLHFRNARSLPDALRWMAARGTEERERLIQGARRTAEEFSMDRTATKALEIYESLLGKIRYPEAEENAWQQALRRIKLEWELLKNFGRAARAGVTSTPTPAERE